MAKVKVTAGMVFERHEKKYRLSEETYQKLMEKLYEYMQCDQYGKHIICSLYFDTDDYLLIRRSIGKPKYKEKMRLRSYGIPTPQSTVFLELKKKLDGITYKRRIPMTFSDAIQYINEGKPPEENGQILEEVNWFMNIYKPSPKVLVFYERIALFGIEDNNLRVTFDSDIRWRSDRLFEMVDDGTPLILPGERIMEIKVNGSFPCWLSRILSELKIYPTSFSKYGTVYRNMFMEKNERENLTYAK